MGEGNDAVLLRHPAGSAGRLPTEPGLEPGLGEAHAAALGETWAVILAAGEGKRLHSVTAGPEGAVPKQYWAPFGERSMLRWALERAAQLVASDRILVVVAEEHRSWWQQELRELPPGNVIVQPKNRGTAAGLLLPLLLLDARDPQARVVVLPSDHFVAQEWTLLGALHRALKREAQPADDGPAPRHTRAALQHRDRILLLGMAAEAPEPGYGWLVPAPRECDAPSAPRQVLSFVEKPSSEEAAQLWRRGALINSFIVVARARALLELYQTGLPRLLAALRSALGEPEPGPALREVYEQLATQDFSRDLLQAMPERLALLPVPPCGWTDLGTPERVRRCLEQQQRPGARS